MAAEKVLCFMTFCEYFDIFFNLLHLIHNLRRCQRLEGTPKTSDVPDSFAERLRKEIECCEQLPVVSLSILRRS